MAASHQIVHGLLVVRVEPQRPLVSQLGRLIVPPRTGEGLGHVVVNLVDVSLVKYVGLQGSNVNHILQGDNSS